MDAGLELQAADKVTSIEAALVTAIVCLGGEALRGPHCKSGGRTAYDDG
jgi:hypothetical protein